jgi:hypothetical protein
MVCYAVPTIAAIVHFGLRKNIIGWKKSISHFWLGLMLAGGAIFGVVDHLWNGELFLIGENIVSDLLLGVTITAVILVVWAIVVTLNKTTQKKPVKIIQ